MNNVKKRCNKIICGRMKRFMASAIIMPMMMCGFAGACAEEQPVFSDVSVHDPSIIRAEDGTFYIFGSHMAAAKSDDLMNWELISSDATNEGCTLFENVQEALEPALRYAKTKTFWAPDV